jgi:hypothetical protein
MRRREKHARWLLGSPTGVEQTMISFRAGVSALAVATIAATATAADEPAPATPEPATLEAQFRDPPASARPRVWWHWMNGNVTKDGIAKDMAWMKRVGIGGLQNFDANVATPQVVDKRLAYMSPEWKEAFRFAAAEADRLGLELAIASSPGWTETGGPWVKPEDGMKKLAWSETIVPGGRRFVGKLAKPPETTGLFQTLKGDPLHGLPLGGDVKLPASPELYVDQVVLAVPAEAEEAAAVAAYSDGAGKSLLGAAMVDGDMESFLEVARPAKGAPMLGITYDKPQTVRSATLHMPGAGSMHFAGTVDPRLESSLDGQIWRQVAAIPMKLVPTTVAFAPVTARFFRIVFDTPKGAGFDMAPPPAGVDFRAAGDLAASAMAPKPIRVGLLRLSSRDRVDLAEAKAGFSILSDYTGVSAGVPDVRGIPLAQVIDLTSRMRPDGTLDWQPPKGRWRVLRMGYSLVGTVNHPASAEATGLEVDKFDGEAVRRYLEHYLGLYKDAAGSELVGRRGVRALLMDSIEVGPSNWTPRIVTQFRKLRGYDPTPWLPALIGTIVQSRTETDRFLFDYRRTLGDLMASEHYGTVAKVAHENGLIVYGEALEADRSSLGDDMAMRSHADVPMAAVWYFAEKKNPSLSATIDIKGAASVAHVYGKPVVAAESMTSFLAPWAFGPRNLKRIVDAEFALGVNRPVIHTSVHSPVEDKLPGVSLGVFGQHFNRQEAWAELAKPWVDYIARNSFLLQQGRNVADIAYFYGEEAPLTGLFSEKPAPGTPKSVAYDYVNAEVLTKLLTNDGADLVTPGGARYRALFLGGSSRMMTLATLRRLAELVEGGATVIGAKPMSDPGLQGDAAAFTSLAVKLWPGGSDNRVGNGRVIVGSEVEAAMAQAGIAPDFRFTGHSDAQIPFVHRKLADGDSYFLVNRKDRRETIEARFRVTGKAPELWHAEDGTSEPLSYRTENGETVIALTLAPEEAVHVVFRKPAHADSLLLRKWVPVERGTVSGPWQVSFQAGRGAPARATLPQLVPLNEHAEPGIKYFSGIATYSSSFTAPKGWKRGQPLWLDLGEAHEVAEVRVNGTPVGSAWHAPYRVDVSKAAKPGPNTLQVRVANLWINRLIGDAQPGAAKVTWTALPTYTAKAPLRPSGLIGPVTVLGE